jgi:hypothetical protein
VTMSSTSPPNRSIRSSKPQKFAAVACPGHSRITRATFPAPTFGLLHHDDIGG